MKQKTFYSLEFSFYLIYLSPTPHLSHPTSLFPLSRGFRRPSQCRWDACDYFHPRLCWPFSLPLVPLPQTCVRVGVCFFFRCEQGQPTLAISNLVVPACGNHETRLSSHLSHHPATPGRSLMMVPCSTFFFWLHSVFVILCLNLFSVHSVFSISCCALAMVYLFRSLVCSFICIAQITCICFWAYQHR